MKSSVIFCALRDPRLAPRIDCTPAEFCVEIRSMASDRFRLQFAGREPVPTHFQLQRDCDSIISATCTDSIEDVILRGALNYPFQGMLFCRFARASHELSDFFDYDEVRFAAMYMSRMMGPNLSSLLLPSPLLPSPQEIFWLCEFLSGNTSARIVPDEIPAQFPDNAAKMTRTEMDRNGQRLAVLFELQDRGGRRFDSLLPCTFIVRFDDKQESRNDVSCMVGYFILTEQFTLVFFSHRPVARVLFIAFLRDDIVFTLKPNVCTKWHPETRRSNFPWRVWSPRNFDAKRDLHANFQNINYFEMKREIQDFLELSIKLHTPCPVFEMYQPLAIETLSRLSTKKCRLFPLGNTHELPFGGEHVSLHQNRFIAVVPKKKESCLQ